MWYVRSYCAINAIKRGRNNRNSEELSSKWIRRYNGKGANAVSLQSESEDEEDDEEEEDEEEATRQSFDCSALYQPLKKYPFAQKKLERKNNKCDFLGLVIERL